MGIQGLLPLFKNHYNKAHISEFKGKKVAIDAYVWLHRGAYSCSAELCQNKPTDKYLGYCMHMVNMLKHNKVIPVLVFDGARLPSKADTESDRRSRRKEAMEQAQIHLQNHRYEQANECFRKAVDIKPSMAYQLISQCKKEGVEIVVAPYEADAQLAHLARTGYVSCVITEDSDLIPYGAPNVFFKMDKYGHGTLLNLAEVNNTPSASGSTDFSKFTHDMMMRMCILSGCDYLSSLTGVGPKTAYKIIKENKTVPKIMEALRKMGKFKKMESSSTQTSSSQEISSSPSLSLPTTTSSSISSSQETNSITEEEYRESFVKAELTFKHQRIYDITSQQMKCLTDPPSCLTEEDLYFCGPVKPPDIVVRICTGMIDPMSHKPFVTAPTYTSSSNSKANNLTPLKTNLIQSYFTPATPPPSTTTPRQKFIPPFKVPLKTTPTLSQEAITISQETPTTSSKKTTSKFFTPKESSCSQTSSSTPVKTPTTATTTNSSTIPSQENHLIDNNPTVSNNSGSAKKSLFSTLFTSLSQEVNSQPELVPTQNGSLFNNNSTPPANIFSDDLTTALIKNEKKKQALMKKMEDEQDQQFDFMDDYDPPSPVLMKTPAREYSTTTVESLVGTSKRSVSASGSSGGSSSSTTTNKKASPPQRQQVAAATPSLLTTSTSESSLKKRKGSFLDRFKKTPNSSQKESSQGGASSYSSQNSSSSSEPPSKSSLPSADAFMYDLSDDDLELLGPLSKKTRQSVDSVVEISSEDDDEDAVESIVNPQDEKNVFELFLSYSKKLQ